MSPQSIADFHAVADFRAEFAAFLARKAAIEPALDRLDRAGYAGAGLAIDGLNLAWTSGDGLDGIARVLDEVDGQMYRSPDEDCER